MYPNKSELYQLFDKDGIKVKSMIQMSISIELEGGAPDPTYKNLYLPIPGKIDMSEAELSRLIVDYIYDTTSLNIESINNIDKHPSINGLPFLLKLEETADCVTTFAFAFGKVPGSVTIRQDHNIESLGNIEEINGDLGLIGTSLTSLGKLKTVAGSFWIAQFKPYTCLQSLNNLETVGKDLYLKGSPIKTLSKLKKVGGTLNLRKTDIQSLGDLEFVGNHIYLPKSKKDLFDFSNIKINGKVKYFN